jgi:ribonuclease E
VITESAKSALAQIAASTIHTAAEDAPEAAEVPAVTLTTRSRRPTRARASVPVEARVGFSLLGTERSERRSSSTRC